MKEEARFGKNAQPGKAFGFWAGPFVQSMPLMTMSE